MLLLLSIIYSNAIKIQIKQLLHKKYYIQKIEITPKRLKIGIHNVNKSGLAINFYRKSESIKIPHSSVLSCVNCSKAVRAHPSFSCLNYR
jgi:propanediol dehydratase small subunit